MSNSTAAGSQPRPNGSGEAPDPFDLESIKARPEDYGTITTKKMPDEIEIGRPNPKAFIRVHPDCHIDLPLVIDKEMSFWDAMELSRKTVYHNWWRVLWLIVVCGLINFGGGLLCCVGVFFTLPLTGLAMMYAYNDVFGAIPAKSA